MFNFKMNNMNNLGITPQVFLAPGDVVIVKHNIENRPKMVVIEKVSKNVRNEDNTISPVFMGMKCRWFDKNQVLQEAVWSTKDLELV